MPQKKRQNKILEYDEGITKKGQIKITYKKGQEKTTVTLDKQEMQDYPYIALRQVAYQYAKAKFKLKPEDRRKLNAKTYIKYHIEPLVHELNAKERYRQSKRQAKIKQVLSRLPRISTYLKAGESAVTLKPEELDNTRESVYNRLLKPIVKHKGLINSLINHTHDWKHYLTFTARIEGIDGIKETNPLGVDAKTYQTRTIEEFREILEECGVQEENAWDSTTEQALKEKGIADIRYLTTSKRGTIHNVLITVKLRKARNG